MAPVLILVPEITNAVITPAVVETIISAVMKLAESAAAEEIITQQVKDRDYHE